MQEPEKIIGDPETGGIKRLLVQARRDKVIKEILDRSRLDNKTADDVPPTIDFGRMFKPCERAGSILDFIMNNWADEKTGLVCETWPENSDLIYTADNALLALACIAYGWEDRTNKDAEPKYYWKAMELIDNIEEHIGFYNLYNREKCSIKTQLGSSSSYKKNITANAFLAAAYFTYTGEALGDSMLDYLEEKVISYKDYKEGVSLVKRRDSENKDICWTFDNTAYAFACLAGRRKENLLKILRGIHQQIGYFAMEDNARLVLKNTADPPSSELHAADSSLLSMLYFILGMNEEANQLMEGIENSIGFGISGLVCDSSTDGESYLLSNAAFALALMAKEAYNAKH